MVPKKDRKLDLFRFAFSLHVRRGGREKDQTQQQQQQQQKSRTIVEEEWLLECPLCRDLLREPSSFHEERRKIFLSLGKRDVHGFFYTAIYRDNRSYATFQKIHPYRSVRPLDRRSPLR